MRPTSRSEENIKMYLQEIRCEVVEWIQLVQDRSQWRALIKHYNDFYGSLKGGGFLNHLSDRQHLKKGSATWRKVAHPSGTYVHLFEIHIYCSHNS